MTERRGDWIQSFTGKRFWPLDPRPEDVDILDIAHSLSNTCRFAGHCKTFYSVAQHSVIASEIVPFEAATLALLHDAAEAYMGDIARPWKRYLWVGNTDGVQSAGFPFERLKAVEKTLLSVILAALGVAESMPLWHLVDDADVTLLATEARDLMAPLHPDWHHQPKNGFHVLPDPIEPWAPGKARWTFLDRYSRLTGKTPR